MKIWSDTLSMQDLHDAAREVRADFAGCKIHLEDGLTLHVGPRTRRFDGVKLRAVHGFRRPNSGRDGGDSAKWCASYAEHGWWMARVFRKDPHARILGALDYRGEDTFHDLTYGAFIIDATPRELQVRRVTQPVAA